MAANANAVTSKDEGEKEEEEVAPIRSSSVWEVIFIHSHLMNLHIL